MRAARRHDDTAMLPLTAPRRRAALGLDVTPLLRIIDGRTYLLYASHALPLCCIHLFTAATFPPREQRPQGAAIPFRAACARIFSAYARRAIEVALSGDKENLRKQEFTLSTILIFAFLHKNIFDDEQDAREKYCSVPSLFLIPFACTTLIPFDKCAIITSLSSLADFTQ